jgi:hypothetical protein
MKNMDREKNADPRKDCICWRKYLKVNIEQKFFTREHFDIHQPNTLAKRIGKRIQDIYSRGDPFCESAITVLGLCESGHSLSKDGKDSLGGIARLEGGKERMGDQIFLGLSFVCF